MPDSSCTTVRTSIHPQRRHRDMTLILSFIIPIVILEAAYAFHLIYPFGNRDVMLIDLYHQYAPFLSELQEKIWHQGSLLYSWTGGLGTSFLPQYAYYLASPLNILVALFPKQHITEAVLLLILIKAGLSGAFFSLFVKEVYHIKGQALIAFSVLYALSGYALAYSWCIMWLEGIYLLPLIMLGLVRLVKEGRFLLYALSLGLLLFSNFYIAFFVCLFTLFYLPVLLIKYQSFGNPRMIFKRVAQFTGSSLLGAGLAAALLFPTLYALQLTSAAGEYLPRSLVQYFDLFDYISRHFMLASPSIREGMPNLYCGLAALILIPFYFLSRSISLKEKIAHAVLIFFLIISFNTNILNFIWHGFHFPNQLPYRNSFIYIFLLLSLACAAYRKLGEFSGRFIGAVCAAFFLIVIFSQKLDKQPLDTLILYINLIFITAYAVALTWNRGRNKRVIGIAVALLIVVCTEAAVNTIFTIDKIDATEHYASREGYLAGKDTDDIIKQLQAIKESGNGFYSGKEFYRVEITHPRTANDTFLYNLRGLSIFSSTFQEKPVHMIQNLGFHSNGINSYEYEGSTLVLDSLFGIKYLIRRSDEVEEKLRTLFSKSGNISVYMNPYALPLGFAALPGLIEWRSSASADPFSVQNSLVENICGVKDVLLPLEVGTGAHINATVENSWGKRFSYTRTDDKWESTLVLLPQIAEGGQISLYFDTKANLFASGTAMVGEKKISFNASRSTIVDLGYINSGTKVEIQLKLSSKSDKTGSFSLYASRLDQEAFERAIVLIRENALTIDRFSDTLVSGSIDMKNDGLLMISTPYDTGWKVRVDGMEVKTKAIDECLLSFNVPQGIHKIEMRFVPEKFLIGLLITCISILIMLFFYVFSRRQKKKTRKIQEGCF